MYVSTHEVCGVHLHVFVQVHNTNTRPCAYVDIFIHLSENQICWCRPVALVRLHQRWCSMIIVTGWISVAREHSIIFNSCVLLCLSTTRIRSNIRRTTFAYDLNHLIKLIVSRTLGSWNKSVNIVVLFQLALIQTRHVIASLQKIYPKEKFEIRKWRHAQYAALFFYTLEYYYRIQIGELKNKLRNNEQTQNTKYLQFIIIISITLVIHIVCYFFVSNIQFYLLTISDYFFILSEVQRLR